MYLLFSANVADATTVNTRLLVYIVYVPPLNILVLFTVYYRSYGFYYGGFYGEFYGFFSVVMITKLDCFDSGYGYGDGDSVIDVLIGSVHEHPTSLDS